MRVLVVTVVHVPGDARILHRQIQALLEGGHDVTFAAPWSAHCMTPPPGLRVRDLPRAQGRRRLRALRAARRLLRELAPTVDLVLLHDPELLAALPGLRLAVSVVWDVHEDTAAAVVDKPWLPGGARRATATAIRLVERVAESRVHLLLAEQGYRARFRRQHPVVPNAPALPPEVQRPGPGRVVYLGRVARGRGALELVELARRLSPDVCVDVIGPADPDVREALESAAAAGVLRWHGFVPNDRALPMLAGATAGLSLVHDEPNHRVSLQTKVLEYLAWGVPVVTTPLPHPAALVEQTQAGFVVPFGDVAAAEAAVRRLHLDERLRSSCAERGRGAVLRHYDWSRHGKEFVEVLERWARDGRQRR